MSAPRVPGVRWKLAVFVAVSLAVLLTILTTIRPLGSGTSRRSFTAEFTSASHLHPGEDVRVAGVKVGSVGSVDVTGSGLARVAFSLDSDLELTRSSTLEIRYLDLAGNRYLAVLPGSASDPAQPAGEVIAAERTRPALDVNDLLAGFKPLLLGLSPADVNDLSLEIVRTLQGDGPTVQHLIQRTASLTTGLAQRDQLIGEVVTNLNTAVGSISAKHTQLEQLIRALSVFAGGLATDRQSVGRAIAHIDEMTALSSDLLRRSRPALRGDVRHLRAVARTLSSPTGHAEIDHAMDHLPDKLTRLAATAGYGSWFNYYVCGVRVYISPGARRADPVLAARLARIHLVDTAARCAE